jgi:hypothetical protein
MMEHVRHHHGSQDFVSKRQQCAIEDDAHPGGRQDLRSNQSRNEFAEKSRTRADLEHWCVPGRKRFGDRSVPLLVDATQKRLLIDNATTLFIEIRVVEIESPREGMS